MFQSKLWILFLNKVLTDIINMCLNYTKLMNKNFLASYFICLFFTLASVFPTLWSGNELMYFGLTNNRDVSLGIAGTAFFETSNHRLFFDLIVGSLINILGFDQAKFFLGILIWFGYGLSITLLSKNFEINPFLIGLILSIFLGSQSLLGGEWLFGTVEPKTLAYPLVILAFSFAMVQKWVASFILILFSICFHFLVGSFWGLSIMLLFVFDKLQFRNVMLIVVVFIFFGILTAYFLLKDNTSIIEVEGIATSIAEIYGPFRHSHHIAPFSEGIKEFSKAWLPGFLGHLSLAVIIFFSLYQSSNKYANVGKLLVILNLYIVLALIISYIDRDTHIFAQLYMFRPSSLILLISMMFISINFNNSIDKNNMHFYRLTLLLISFNLYFNHFGQFASSLLKTMESETRYEASLTINQEEIIDWLEINTSLNEIVLIDSFDESNPFFLGIEIFKQRRTYVNWKLIPTNKIDMIEWYKRLIIRKDALDGNCKNFKLVSAKYVIHETKDDISNQCLEPVLKNKDYLISKVIQSP